MKIAVVKVTRICYYIDARYIVLRCICHYDYCKKNIETKQWKIRTT